MIQIKSTPLLFAKTGIAAAIAVASSTASYAQLEEVLVTAQKRQQTVQDVPSSVAAFNEDMLTKSQTRNFDDLSQIASGMEITASGDGFGSIIKIRGVGNNSFAPAIRPAVGIFLDDIPLSSAEAAYNNMADIQRIEVLKGPQATLFGKEVSAGAISLFTKKPDTEAAEGYVEGNFGNYDRIEYRVGGNVPLGENFAIRGSLYHNENDGPVENLSFKDDAPSLDADGYRLRLLFETEKFQAVLGYEDHETDVIGSASIVQTFGDIWSVWETDVEGVAPEDSILVGFDPEDYTTNNVSFSDRNTTTEIWSLHLEYLINDEWTFNSVTGDQEYFLETQGAPGVGSSYDHPANAGIVNPRPGFRSAGATLGPYRISDFIQDSGTDSFTQEFRLTYSGDNWSSIAGVFYAETDLLSIVDFNQTFGVLGGTPAYAPGISTILDDTEEWAIFTHNIYSINEGLDLTFGIRYSEVEKTATKGQTFADGVFGNLASFLITPTPWANDIPEQKDDWSEVTGTVKVTYWLTEEMSMYAGWDRGFKAGGHNVCKDSARAGIIGPDCPEPFESETADNFEIGLKGRFLENTLVFNGAVFYQQYDDYQVEIQDDVGIGNSVVNAASVKIQGIEGDFQWLANENFLLDGNFAYIDSRWDEFEDAGCVRPQFQRERCSLNAEGKDVQDLSGKRLNYSAPWSANLNATWNDSFDNGIDWFIRGEITFKDDRIFFPDLDPEVTDGSYTVFNASIGLSSESGNWDVTLWGKNLTNTDYLTQGERHRDNNSLSAAPVEGYRVTAGIDRTYGVTLKYRFGDFQ